MLFNKKHIKTQTILLTFQGKLVSSCDSLFDSQSLVPYPVHEGLPMLDSIIQTFQNKPTSKILLPRVETSYGNLPGFYDFTFDTVVVDKKKLIRWIIYDFTSQYKNLQQEQQQSHERDINNS